MKKVAIITFYDMICYGTRLISTVAKEQGIESHLILVKDEKSHVPIWKDKDQYATYQYFYNGLKRGCLYAIDPITETEKKLLLTLLREINPELICLSTRSFAYEICKEIFPRIKQILPNVPIISGGWGPTLEPDKFLEFSDFVFFGEGERSFKDICQTLKTEATPTEDIKKANNLIYYDNGNLIKNPVAKPLNSDEMDEMAFPDFDEDNKYLIANNKIRLGNDFYNEKIYDCFAGRGCPMSCSYCMSSKYGQLYRDNYQINCPKYRLRSVDRVIEELKRGKENGAKVIRIKDEVFPISKRWLEDFLPKYKQEIDLPFFGYIRPEYHPPDIVKKIINAGLYITILGIQSGSDEIRKNIYFRRLSKDKIVTFANLLKEYELDYLYHFIYRNPFEQEKHMEETLELIYQLPFAPICTYKLQRFPGSPIDVMIEKKNPQGADLKTNLWYAILYTLASKGPVYRRICKFIHKHRVLRKYPMFLSLLFLMELSKECKTYIVNTIIYGAKARLLPSKKLASPITK